MCTTGDGHAPGAAFGSVAEALRAGSAVADFLNSPAAAGLDGAACGEVLLALGGIQAKLAAAYAGFLRRFDAASAHDADGYGSSSAWLAARAQLTKRDARAAVRQMRQFGQRKHLAEALAAGAITGSWAAAIAGLDAGSSPRTCATRPTGSCSTPRRRARRWMTWPRSPPARSSSWRQQQPDPDHPDDGFDDRYVQVGTTFGGAGVIRGNLTPQCAAAVRAVVEALGKKAGPEDDRTEGKRFHDALQLACELLLRAKLVPDRAGADTQVIAHIPLSQLRQLPGAQRPGRRLDPRLHRRGRLPDRQGRRGRRLRRADRPGRHRHHGPRGHRPDDRPGPHRGAGAGGHLRPREPRARRHRPGNGRRHCR